MGRKRLLAITSASVAAMMVLASCTSPHENRHNQFSSASHSDFLQVREPDFVPPEEKGQGFISGGEDRGKRSDDPREIVCWGDSMTEGVGADRAIVNGDGFVFDASYLSYPEVLEKLTGIKTFNFGVAGATSEEIAFMQGALSEEQLLEPVDAFDYDISEQAKAHTGDVLVLEMGSNGGWDGDYEKLIAQYRMMIEHSGCSDYIIIGDTDDPGTSEADPLQESFENDGENAETNWERTLRETFGEHFINMRSFLVNHGLEVCGLEATPEDAIAASMGCVSEQLRADWTHLNSYGYYAQAIAVYEKGQSLGYW